jgi:transposase-like protein
MASINGSQEPLEIEVIIRRELHSEPVIGNQEPSIAVVSCENQSPIAPLCVDTLPKAVSTGEEGVRTRRSQRDYSLPFKLAVVGEVGRGELSYKQAQRRYGIQGRSTVLNWCRRYANHLADFHAYRTALVGTLPIVEVNPEQRIKQLETQLREQKAQYEKQLQKERNKGSRLRTKPS